MSKRTKTENKGGYPSKWQASHSRRVSFYTLLASCWLDLLSVWVHRVFAAPCIDERIYDAVSLSPWKKRINWIRFHFKTCGQRQNRRSSHNRCFHSLSTSSQQYTFFDRVLIRQRYFNLYLILVFFLQFQYLVIQWKPGCCCHSALYFLFLTFKFIIQDEYKIILNPL